MTDTQHYKGPGLSKQEFADRLHKAWREKYLFYPMPNTTQKKETTMTTPETTETWQEVADRHAALGLDKQKSEAGVPAPIPPKAFVITADEMEVIYTCLLSFGSLLNWADDMVAWVETNLDLYLDMPPATDEYGNPQKTSREWVNHMRASRLPDHREWWKAAKDIKRRPAIDPTLQPVGTLPEPKLAKPTDYIPKEFQPNDNS